MAMARPAQHLRSGEGGALREGTEMAEHFFARDRFAEIFGGAQAAGDFAVEVGVLDLPHHQHGDIGLDHMGQFAQRAERLFFA